jgi:hypothetical protein
VLRAENVTQVRAQIRAIFISMPNQTAQLTSVYQQLPSYHGGFDLSVAVTGI